MIFAFDVGNSHIVIGMVEDGRVQYTVRFHTDPRETATEYIIKLRQITISTALIPRPLRAAFFPLWFRG